jgi:hypothetical protein
MRYYQHDKDQISQTITYDNAKSMILFMQTYS